uniref:Uncharacterized protein n=1 Tax=Malurus cyaneus samueli TaxID=2593467 RepID=A0A8C5X2Q9_9PASS
LPPARADPLPQLWDFIWGESIPGIEKPQIPDGHGPHPALGAPRGPHPKGIGFFPLLFHSRAPAPGKGGEERICLSLGSIPAGNPTSRTSL